MIPFQINPEHPLRVAVLGSTGSVGTQSMDVLAEMGCRVVMLSAGSNVELMAEQYRRFHPEICTMETEEAANALRLSLAGEPVHIYGGVTAVCDAVRVCKADLILHSIAGLAGLPAALAAAETGARIGMANKEAIISAGEMIFSALRKSGGQLIPVDSEHSAIFQCLAGSGASPTGDGNDSMIKRILLTASGGPFYGMTVEQLQHVTPAQALAHPTWNMGPKITVDSATLMNKGFEVIEAVQLFHVPIEKVEVLIHRQSIIHSMVEYIDNSVIAQLAYPDMRACVRYAVSYPQRAQVAADGVDFLKLGSVSFDTWDPVAFPLLGCVADVVRRGGTTPASLIAADEAAVVAFLNGKLSFLQIAEVVLETLAVTQSHTATTPDDIFSATEETRKTAEQILMKYC